MKKKHMQKAVMLTVGTCLLLCGCTSTRNIIDNQISELEENAENGQQVDETAEETTKDIPEETTAESSQDEQLLSRDIAAVTAYLAAFPEELTELQQTESYIVLHGIERSGREYLDDFLTAVEAKTPAELVTIAFTIEGDPIFCYINYDGTDFYAVSDSSRDAFAGDGARHEDVTYPYLNVITGTEENGDVFQYLLLSKQEELTLEDVEIYWSQLGMQGTEEEIYYISYAVLRNENAILTGDEAFHQVATIFDETSVLVDMDQVAKITVYNGNNGEQKDFEAGDEVFEEIRKLYEKLDFQVEESLEYRSGYAYRVAFFDKNDVFLDGTTPYKDAVIVNGNIYDASMNGTSLQLLQYLDTLW